MRRRVAASLTVAVLAGVVVAAQAAPKPPAYAPTVAFKAQLATTGKQLPNVPIRYAGAPLRFVGTKLPRGAAEPTIGVTKKGTAYTTTSEFDAAGGTLSTTVIQRSKDGGRTWSPINLGVTSGDRNAASLDPYVYVDTDYGRAFNVDLAGAGTVISWTDETGEVTGQGFATVLGVNDHQTLVTAAPPKGNPLLVPTDPSFPKIVYYCVNTVVRVACAHSTDGGRTYLEAGTSPSAPVSTGGGIVCGSLHGHIVADRDGRLFLPRNECGRMVLGVSEDGGLTWTTRTVALGLPGMDPDASVAVDRSGNLYYVWYDERSLPFLSVSKDHGASWSPPRMIAPPGVKEAWFPVVDVGDPGRMAVWFMGSRQTAAQDKSNTRPWGLYSVVSTNALSADPTFVSTLASRPDDPVHRGDCSGRCGNVFDFLDVVSAPADQGRIWATSVDTCTGVCAEEEVRGYDDSTESSGRSNASDGVVFRQVSGPALRGSAPITRDTRR